MVNDKEIINLQNQIKLGNALVLQDQHKIRMAYIEPEYYQNYKIVFEIFINDYILKMYDKEDRLSLMIFFNDYAVIGGNK